VERPGIEPATFCVASQHPDHYTTKSDSWLGCVELTDSRWTDWLGCGWLQIPQVPAVPRLPAAGVSRRKGRRVLQDDERVCAGVSDDAGETAAAAREEGDAEGATEDTRQNDRRGL